MKSFKNFLNEQSNTDSELVKVFSSFILSHKNDSMIANSKCLEHLKIVFEKDFNDNDDLKSFLNNPTSSIIAATHFGLFHHKSLSVKSSALAVIKEFNLHLETALDEYKELYLNKDTV